MQSQDQQIKILKRIGKGSYGEVFLCEDSQGHQFALKAIKRNLLDDKFQNSYKHELNALKKLQSKQSHHEDNKKDEHQSKEAHTHAHTGFIKRSNSFDQELCFVKEQNSQLHTQEPQFNFKSNIIQYIKNIDNYSFTFSSKSYSCHALFIEYAKNGCLGDYLESPKFVSLPITILRRIAKQLFHGIQEMHDAHLVHRDIKEDNIVFSESFNVKIIDLSFAGRNDNEVCGTQKYISPEILKLEVQMMSDVSPQNNDQKTAQKEKNFQRFTKVDTFAAGVVLFRLMAKKFPFTSASRFDHRYKHIVSKQYDQFWKDIKLILTEYESGQSMVDFSEFLHNHQIEEETLHDLETSSNSIDSALANDIENMESLQNQESSDNQDNSESQSASDKQEQESQKVDDPIIISNADLRGIKRNSKKLRTYVNSKRASSEVNCFFSIGDQQFFNDLMHKSTKNNANQQRHSMSEIASFKEQIDHLKDLIQHLLAFDVEERYTVEQALNHPFFSSFKKYEHSKFIASSKDLQTFFSQIN